MATPSAPPIWKAVLLRPEASPDSWSATPASAATVAVTKARPIPGPTDEQPEEDVAEVAAADGDLCEQQRPCAHQRHARRGDRPEADPEDRGLSEDRADRTATGEDDRAEPELDGRVAEHLLRVEREDERQAEREGRRRGASRGWPRRACASGGCVAARAAPRWRDSISANGARSTADAGEQDDRLRRRPSRRWAPRRARRRAGRARR